MYAPVYKSAKVLRRYDLGDYAATLYGAIVPRGYIAYGHILEVVDKTSGLPCLHVASELNAAGGVHGLGSHYLCLYPGDGHINLGCSDSWADEDKFARAALKQVRARIPVGRTTRLPA